MLESLFAWIVRGIWWLIVMLIMSLRGVRRFIAGFLGTLIWMGLPVAMLAAASKMAPTFFALPDSPPAWAAILGGGAGLALFASLSWRVNPMLSVCVPAIFVAGAFLVGIACDAVAALFLGGFELMATPFTMVVLGSVTTLYAIDVPGLMQPDTPRRGGLGRRILERLRPSVSGDFTALDVPVAYEATFEPDPPPPSPPMERKPATPPPPRQR